MDTFWDIERFVVGTNAPEMSRKSRSRSRRSVQR
jgi:hypothetical protein